MLELSTGLSVPRLHQRENLLRDINRTCDATLRSAAVADLSVYQARAADLLLSNATRQALQMDREPRQTRDRYGRNIFGQSCLLARRLIEAGIPLVAVYTYGSETANWDTHASNFRDLKEKILPVQDRGFAALLEDLDVRGLLEETLVAWFGDFGRTPRINSNNGGRDHWPSVFTALFAGGGIRGGIVHGASDRIGAYPVGEAVTAQDVAATIYHCLGIDPQTTIRDRLGRPFEVALGGRPIMPLMA